MSFMMRLAAAARRSLFPAFFANPGLAPAKKKFSRIAYRQIREFVLNLVHLPLFSLEVILCH